MGRPKNSQPTLNINVTEVLFHGNVFVYVLATSHGIVEDEAEHGNDEPVAGHIAGGTGNPVLDERHDASAYDHHHEDAGSLLGVFAETLDGEVEDAAPHERGAETAEDDEECAGGNDHHSEAAPLIARHRHGHALGQEDSHKEEDDGHGRNDGDLGLGRDFAADGCAGQTT